MQKESTSDTGTRGQRKWDTIHNHYRCTNGVVIAVPSKGLGEPGQNGGNIVHVNEVFYIINTEIK